MEIRIRQTGAVMYESELRSYLRANNGPSYGELSHEVMEALGVDPVLEGPQATTTPPYQYSQRAGVEQLDGKWYTKYVAGPVFTDAEDEHGHVVTAAEQEAAYKAQKDTEQAKSVRASRDAKLAETDWRYRRDQTTTSEWDAYCQALRDVPAQAGFPWAVDWPTQP